MGGGSQNELFNRLTANAAGLLVIHAGTECATIGNFAVQLAALEDRNEVIARPTCGWAAQLNRLDKYNHRGKYISSMSAHTYHQQYWKLLLYGTSYPV
jgi:sugar (pentulose or hexulose) kinase